MLAEECEPAGLVGGEELGKHQPLERFGEHWHGEQKAGLARGRMRPERSREINTASALADGSDVARKGIKNGLALAKALNAKGDSHHRNGPAAGPWVCERTRRGRDFPTGLGRSLQGTCGQIGNRQDSCLFRLVPIWAGAWEEHAPLRQGADQTPRVSGCPAPRARSR
jgi:hypothetical protein